MTTTQRRKHFVIAFCSICDDKCDRCTSILNYSHGPLASTSLTHAHSLNCKVVHSVTFASASSQGLAIPGDPDVIIIPMIRPVEQRF